MLVISSCPAIKNTYSYSSFGEESSLADTNISNGDKALNENNFEQALTYYNQALNSNPQNYDLYRKIAKTQFNLKNYAVSEENYKKYLEKNPDDVEGIIELGEVQRQKGSYNEALKNFEKALELDKNNDLAKRSILETKNNILSCYNSTLAMKEKQEYAEKNLKSALQIASNYMSVPFMREISDVEVKFGETAKMGGTSNIAQYENSKNSITVSNSYIYAAPEVIAAYLVHESIHAKDKDAYTSVREEQDAYQTATKFWIKNSKGIKDPEMDYAAELYKKSPVALSDRVREIYELRDPDIAKTSPHHPENKKFQFAFPKTKTASQPIKNYDIIA